MRSSDLENIIKLTANDATAILPAIETLVKLIHWPKGIFVGSIKKNDISHLIHFYPNRYVVSGT